MFDAKEEFELRDVRRNSIVGSFGVSPFSIRGLGVRHVQVPDGGGVDKAEGKRM
jgi:hypothetical protein